MQGSVSYEWPAATATSDHAHPPLAGGRQPPQPCNSDSSTRIDQAVCIVIISSTSGVLMSWSSDCGVAVVAATVAALLTVRSLHPFAPPAHRCSIAAIAAAESRTGRKEGSTQQPTRRRTLHSQLSSPLGRSTQTPPMDERKEAPTAALAAAAGGAAQPTHADKGAAAASSVMEASAAGASAGAGAVAVADAASVAVVCAGRPVRAAKSAAESRLASQRFAPTKRPAEDAMDEAKPKRKYTRRATPTDDTNKSAVRPRKRKAPSSDSSSSSSSDDSDSDSSDDELLLPPPTRKPGRPPGSRSRAAASSSTAAGASTAAAAASSSPVKSSRFFCVPGASKFVMLQRNDYTLSSHQEEVRQRWHCSCSNHARRWAWLWP